MITKGFSDKEMLSDILSSQKYATSGYNTSANESATPAIKTDFMNILNEEHQIQNDVFKEMQKRGWYPVETADHNKIQQTKQRYENMGI